MSNIKIALSAVVVATSMQGCSADSTVSSESTESASSAITSAPLTARWRNYTGTLWASDVLPAPESLENAGNTYPGFGASLNGHRSMGNVSWGGGLVSTVADSVSSIIGATTGTVYVVFQANSAVVDPGGIRKGVPSLVAQNPARSDAGTFRIAYSTSGVHAMICSNGIWLNSFYGGCKWHEVHVPAAVAVPHRAVIRWNGSVLSLRVDNGAWASVAAGPAQRSAGGLIAGYEAAGVGFSGSIWEIGTSDKTVNDADDDVLLGDVKTYYGI